MTSYQVDGHRFQKIGASTGHTVRDVALCDTAKTASDLLDTRTALQQLVDVIEAAGLDKLSCGVELGQTVWFVKASDAMQFAKTVLKD